MGASSAVSLAMSSIAPPKQASASGPSADKPAIVAHAAAEGGKIKSRYRSFFSAEESDHLNPI